jgi:O-antigen ligase
MLERFLDHNNVDSGLTQRFSTVTLAVQVFMDNFLLGVGFSGFRFAAIDYGAENLFFRNLSYSPLFVASTGNQYLQVATDAGVVGLAAFLWMMRDFLRTLKRAEARVVGPLQEQTKAGYLWLLSLAIGNQSAAWLLPGSLISYLVWVSLGLATVTIALTSRQDRA